MIYLCIFFIGLKKILWPVFMGLQVLKSLLIAMFIPAIIGSFTKLLGKGKYLEKENDMY